jgi:hypothetical protein
MIRFFARLFRSRPATIRRPQRQPARLAVEALEERAVPALFSLYTGAITNLAPVLSLAAQTPAVSTSPVTSVSQTASLNAVVQALTPVQLDPTTGIININAWGDQNYCTITYSGANNSQVTVNLNGQSTTFNLSAGNSLAEGNFSAAVLIPLVWGIHYNGGGNDYFANNTDVPCTVYGGAGSDTLLGGGGDDVIYGGSGTNIIDGRGGNDALFGGGGNSIIRAGTGGGLDTSLSHTGQSTLYGGGGGSDDLWGGPADILYGGPSDFLDGGTQYRNAATTGGFVPSSGAFAAVSAVNAQNPSGLTTLFSGSFLDRLDAAWAGAIPKVQQAVQNKLGNLHPLGQTIYNIDTQTPQGGDLQVSNDSGDIQLIYTLRNISVTASITTPDVNVLGVSIGAPQAFDPRFSITFDLAVSMTLSADGGLHIANVVPQVQNTNTDSHNLTGDLVAAASGISDFLGGPDFLQLGADALNQDGGQSFQGAVSGALAPLNAQMGQLASSPYMNLLYDVGSDTIWLRVPSVPPASPVSFANVGRISPTLTTLDTAALASTAATAAINPAVGLLSTDPNAALLTAADELNPQPLPPGPPIDLTQLAADELNPQPLPPGPPDGITPDATMTTLAFTATGPALGAATGRVQQPPVAAATVTFADTQDWGTGFTGSITLTNTGASDVNGWTLEFDFSGNITDIWDAQIVSHVGDHYVIQNADWDATLAAGQSVSFGFNADWTAGQAAPTNYTLNGAALGGANGPALGAAAGRVQQPPVAAATVTFADTQDWGTGFTGSITLTNTGTSDVTGWTLEFDFSGNITDIWDAQIVSHVGDHYVIQNADWDATIAAGQSVSFGFNADWTAGQAAPTNYTLNGAALGGANGAVLGFDVTQARGQ